MKVNSLVILIVLIQTTLNVMAQSLSHDIRLNQIGFLPNSVKYAAVVKTQLDSFKVMSTDMLTTVFEGQFLPSAYYSSSGEDVFLADFTLMTDTGDFVLVVDDIGKSVPFKVNENIFADLAKATLKYYYFNRASVPVLSEYGGKWARSAGHSDTSVIVLPSAATANRPAGTRISTPGGWYDAGDYNKYIVSSGGPVFTLLSAYETYPGFYDTLDLNIPESNNGIPDILDEALYNIKWMMTMQDEDGGVYNKTTEAYFSGFDMPSEVTSSRYVTAKSTAATLDFGAVMAMTARVYRKFDVALADTALAQAKRAWQWARANPDITFQNPSGSGGYPGVNTGEYGDSDFEDEFTWCASELYVTTKDSAYYNEINFDQWFSVPGWPVVQTLGLVSLLVNKDSLTEVADIDMIKNKLINAVSGTKNYVSTSPYRIPGDFYYWSGNNAFANWGMLFMQVFRLTGDAGYYNAAVASLDYLLGKNASTYCYVTGFGSKSPMHPHHRISVADGVNDPVPGMLVGGANGSNKEDCGTSSYPSTYAAKSYLDNVCSYSTNEVAIGINSGLAFLAGSILAEYHENFTDSMPRYMTISKNKIKLPYLIGEGFQLGIDGNTQWELTSEVDWITISDSSGTGSATVLINIKTNNSSDEARTGKIYVYSQSMLADSILVTQNGGARKSFMIEAEDYVEMSGVQTEAANDIGGGENLAFVDVGDWVIYDLDITDQGIYELTIRHAGYEGDFDVLIDDEFIKNVTFPETDDWQVWESYVTEVILTKGQHILKLKFNAEGTNLNWFQFNWKEKVNISHIMDVDVKIYPNPADKILNIDFGSGIVSGLIQIFSIDGKIVQKYPVGDLNFESIDVSGIEKGMYILKINSPIRVITKTLIID